MPTISMFYGIIIRMYTKWEHLPPHFHAIYGEKEAAFTLDGKILEGTMPKTQKMFIKTWATIHKNELIADWNLAINSEEPYKIEPLK
jgi:hypothetical protein